LKHENYGYLKAEDRIEKQVVKLRAVWNRKKENPKKNTLVWTAMSCYKWSFLYLMAGNLISSCLNITQPIFVAYLIKYIQYGDNTFADYGIHFFDFENTSMEWLTEGKQFGLAIGLTMLSTQFLRYIFDENLMYKEDMTGIKAQSALIAMIYEK